MPNNSSLNTVAFISAVFFFLISLSACKDPVIKDKSLVNGPDDLLNLGHIDTFIVLSKTIEEPPYASDGVTYGVLGSMNDPVFGTSVCGFYAQMRLSNIGYVVGTNPVVDSCVFSVVATDKYGSGTQAVNYSVFELSESMGSAVSTGVYKTNESFGVVGAPIGVVYNTVFNTKDSVSILGKNLAPQLRIPLSNTVAQRILNADSATFSSNDNFVNLFKGVYVTAQGTNGNGIVYPYLPATKMTIYYHNNSDDSLHLELSITSSSVRVNHYDHQYSNTIQQAKSSTLISDSVVYVQSGAGTKVKLVIPNLDSLPKGIAVNKAELIVTKWNDDLTGSDSIFKIPSYATLYRIGTDGSAQKLPDFDGAGQAFSKTVSENGVTFTRYSFKLSQYIQQIVSGTYPNNGLYISLSATTNAERLVLANYLNNPNFRIKLRITYTKII